jgi:hypothetical protein
MRLRWFARGVVAALFGLLITLPATAPAPASAASYAAACCKVSIDSLPEQFSAGAEPAPFAVQLTNQTREPLRYLDVTFSLKAEGLVGDLVDMQRQRPTGGPRDVRTSTQRGVRSGAVTATETVDFGTQALPPGGSLTVTYLLAFSKKAQGAALSLSIQVKPRRGDDGVGSAGPYRSEILAVGQPLPTPSEPSPTVEEPSASSGGAAPLGRSPAADSSDDPMVWLTYTLGGLLLLGGIGLIGTLIWRGRQRDDADEDEPVQLGQHAYPQAAGYDAPTQIIKPVLYGTPGGDNPPPTPYPTSQYPVPQDPYADSEQTWIDPPAGR